MLNAAVKWKVIPENPAKLIRNPLPKREEIRPFEMWADVEAVAAELGQTAGAIALFAAGTGLRPEEWLALEWRDVDLKAGVLHVRRVYTDGRVKDYGKQERSRRRLPLRARAVGALKACPHRGSERLWSMRATGAGT